MSGSISSFVGGRLLGSVIGRPLRRSVRQLVLCWADRGMFGWQQLLPFGEFPGCCLAPMPGLNDNELLAGLFGALYCLGHGDDLFRDDRLFAHRIVNIGKISLLCKN